MSVILDYSYYHDGEKTSFTGKTKVQNAPIAKAIGTNLKRASRFLESEARAIGGIGRGETVFIDSETDLIELSRGG